MGSATTYAIYGLLTAGFFLCEWGWLRFAKRQALHAITKIVVSVLIVSIVAVAALVNAVRDDEAQLAKVKLAKLAAAQKNQTQLTVIEEADSLIAPINQIIAAQEGPIYGPEVLIHSKAIHAFQDRTEAKFGRQTFGSAPLTACSGMVVMLDMYWGACLTKHRGGSDMRFSAMKYYLERRQSCADALASAHAPT